MYLFRLISTYLYLMETLGMGDVKISTLIEFIVGTLDVFLAILFGFLIVVIIYILLITARLHKRKSYLPFGPKLVFDMIIYLIYLL